MRLIGTISPAPVSRPLSFELTMVLNSARECSNLPFEGPDALGPRLETLVDEHFGPWCDYLSDCLVHLFFIIIVAFSLPD